MRVLSFNLLAPCYFRHGGQIESQHPSFYLKRAKALLAPMLAVQYDLLVLQEYWFHPTFTSFIKSHLDDKYDSYFLQRPGEKEDGLAFFVLKETLQVKSVTKKVFDRAGERVALLLQLSHKETQQVYSMFN